MMDEESKKLIRRTFITWSIIIVIILIAFLIIFFQDKKPVVDADLVKCISEKSHLFTLLGCSHCKIQKEIFGDRYSILNVTDCFYEKDKCLLEGIEKTPTWEINGEKYEGVQSINKLKELTGC